MSTYAANTSSPGFHGRTGTRPTYGTPLPTHPATRMDVLTRPGAMAGVGAYQAPADRGPMPSWATREAMAEQAMTGGYDTRVQTRRDKATGALKTVVRNRTCGGCMTVMPTRGICDNCE